MCRPTGSVVAGAPPQRYGGTDLVPLRSRAYTRITLGTGRLHASRSERRLRPGRRKGRDGYVGPPRGNGPVTRQTSENNQGGGMIEDVCSTGGRRAVSHGSHRAGSGRSPGAHRAGEVAGTEHAVRATAGRPAGALRRWLREDHVLRGLCHGTRSRVCRRECRLLYGAVCGACQARHAEDRPRKADRRSDDAQRHARGWQSRSAARGASRSRSARPTCSSRRQS